MTCPVKWRVLCAAHIMVIITSGLLSPTATMMAHNVSTFDALLQDICSSLSPQQPIMIAKLHTVLDLDQASLSKVCPFVQVELSTFQSPLGPSFLSSVSHNDVKISSCSFPGWEIFCQVDHNTAYRPSTAKLAAQITKTLALLIRDLMWQELILINDYLDAKSESPFADLEIPFKRPTLVNERPVYADTLTADIHDILDEYSYDATKQQHFLVICSLTCIKQVLYEANLHENLPATNEQGFFTYKDRWILVVLDASELSAIEPFLANITHVTVVGPSTGTLGQIPVHELQDTYQETHLVLGDDTQDYVLFPSHVCHGSSSLEGPCDVDDGTSLDVVVYGALWRPEGRILSEIGSYSGDALTMFDDIFPCEKYGFNGRFFKITTNMWGAFVSRHVDTNGSVHYQGSAIDLLIASAFKLNFTYSLSEPLDGAWGVKTEEGWTGMVKELSEKTVDMQVSPLAIHPLREEYMDFVRAFYVEYSAFLYKPPNTDTKGIDMFFSPLTWQVWIGIIISVPVMGICIYAISKLSPMYETKYDSELQLGQVNKSLWFTFGALINQASVVLNPIPLSVRNAVAFWWLSSMIAVTLYSASLMASLAVIKTSAPFKTLQELSLQSEYKFGTQGGTIWQQLFMNSPGVIFQRMWKSMDGWDQSGIEVLSQSSSVHMDMVNRGGYAYLTDVTVSQLEIAKNCELKMMEELFYPMQYAMGVQNNSAYTSIFSEVVMRLQDTGIMSKWQRDHTPPVEDCNTGGVQRTLGMGDLMGVFVLSSIALAIAFLILIMEFVFYRFVIPKNKSSEIE